MKKLLMTILAFVPLTLWAQDNTWERPEAEQAAEEAARVNPRQKYLAGAVPEVDGKVVFTTTIEAPGKSAAEIYGIIKKYRVKMTKESNQLNSKLIVDDPERFEVSGSYEEWLVFKSAALSLDRTRFMYAFTAKCQDGRADLTLSHIRYFYEELRNPQHLKAEECITDRYAMNKKQTRLYPNTGKFRRKTVDRKDFLFNKIESLLQ